VLERDGEPTGLSLVSCSRVFGLMAEGTVATWDRTGREARGDRRRGGRGLARRRASLRGSASSGHGAPPPRRATGGPPLFIASTRISRQ